MDQKLATALSGDLLKHCMIFQTELDLIPTTEASVSVLLKNNKDPDFCTSYRPISLMNVETEILAKALAYKLEKVLRTIISQNRPSL